MSLITFKPVTSFLPTLWNSIMSKENQRDNDWNEYKARDNRKNNRPVRTNRDRKHRFDETDESSYIAMQVFR